VQRSCFSAGFTYLHIGYTSTSWADVVLVRAFLFKKFNNLNIKKMRTAKIVAVVLCSIATPFILIEGFIKRKKLVKSMWNLMMVRGDRAKNKN
jgi:hypothetical protein